MMRRVVTIVVLLVLCAPVTAAATENHPRLSVYEAHSPNPSVAKSLAGDWVFEGTEGDVVILNVMAPATVWFTWVAVADDYGGTIVGYRSSPDDPFDPDYLGITLGAYDDGTYSFYIEVIDDAGNISRGEFRINVTTGLPVRHSRWGAVKAVYR
jgi:hypothetical protein